MKGTMTGGKSCDPVVVLGFGTAGASAVMALRDAGYAGPIVAVSAEGDEQYSPVLTSYYAGGRIGRERCFAWRDLGVRNMVDAVLAETAAVALNAEAHEVELSDGRRLRYSKLLVATGAHPVAPGFPAASGCGPLELRTMRDADRLKEALGAESCRRVMVAGTSMVALKAAEACLDQGVAATLVGRSPHILRQSAHPAVAQRFEQLLWQRGATMRLSCEIAAVSGGSACDKPGGGGYDSRAGRGVSGGYRVMFHNGAEECFDEVVVAQGVRPNLDFIVHGEIDVDQGVLVDRFMRASAPDVFAAGDVTQAIDLVTGRPRIIGLWQNAVRQGRCAGAAMAAELAGRAPTRTFPGSLASNVIHVRDILFASAGMAAPRDDAGCAVELHETADGIGALVYRQQDTLRQLVGFSLVCAPATPGQRDKVASRIGTLRADVMKSFVYPYG